MLKQILSQIANQNYIIKAFSSKLVRVNSDGS